jgi:integrase
VSALVQINNDDGYLAALFAAVRPEFRGEVVRMDPDSPVFGRGRCEVAGCNRSGWTRQLCVAHYQRWQKGGKGDLDRFRSTTGPVRDHPRSAMIDTFDLSSLAPLPRLEVAYLLQRRHDERGVIVLHSVIRHVVQLVVASGVRSVFDRPLDDWITDVRRAGWGADRTTATFRFAYRELADIRGIDVEAEYASDSWVASRLGMVRRRPPHTISFAGVSQPWLRTAVKRWLRHRLGSGITFGSVAVDLRSMIWFSRFLDERLPESKNEQTIERRHLEDYLSWLIAADLAPHTTSTYIVSLRSFLEACRRHQMLTGLGADVAIYNDDLPSRPRPLPRYISEAVMAQVESPERLDRLPDHTTRALVVVLIETGLRANDACQLAFDTLVPDSGGGPCLRFLNAKMGAEQLVPLSAKAAAAVRDQQDHLRLRWPNGPAFLCPAPQSNPDGLRPFSYGTLRMRLTRWQVDIDLRDETGRPFRFSAHQFRHTLGTRLINQGVPQHVVQRILGHASPQMTARYATLHDTTVRRAFDAYWKDRVSILGERIGFDPAGPTADAEWTKHNLARVQASLPNGYCGRPPQQDCPHPNACLTCPDFQTTPEFLDVHRRQRDDTGKLIATADADGRFRMADNHRKVLGNLVRVITSLETLEASTP